MVRPGGLEPLTPTMSRLSFNCKKNNIIQSVILFLTVNKNRYFKEKRYYRYQ